MQLKKKLISLYPFSFDLDLYFFSPKKRQFLIGLSQHGFFLYITAAMQVVALWKIALD